MLGIFYVNLGMHILSTQDDKIKHQLSMSQ